MDHLKLFFFSGGSYISSLTVGICNITSGVWDMIFFTEAKIWAVELMEACLWSFYGGWIFELQWGPLMVIFHHGDAVEDKREEVRGGAIH